MWKLIGRPRVLRGGPDRIPVLVGERGCPKTSGWLPKSTRAVAGRRAALDLRTRRAHVPERHRRDRDQALGIRAATSRSGSRCRRARTRASARGSLEPQEAARAEAAHVRVEHLRVDPLVVHVRQARLRVVTRRGWRRRAWPDSRAACRRSPPARQCPVAMICVIADEPVVAPIVRSRCTCGHLVAPLAGDARSIQTSCGSEMCVSTSITE